MNAGGSVALRWALGYWRNFIIPDPMTPAGEMILVRNEQYFTFCVNGG